jgi:hypothetical protein
MRFRSINRPNGAGGGKIIHVYITCGGFVEHLSRT